MKVKVIGNWYSTAFGNVEDGQILDMTEDMALQMSSRGWVSLYEIKPEPARPLDAGLASDAGSLPAARPVRKTSKKSGEKAK